MLVAGAATWIFHSLFDGQAGFGWGLLGAVIGSAISMLATIALQSSVFGILVAAVASVLLPPLGAAIALEARDGALRRGEVSTLGPSPGLLVAAF